MALDNVLVPVQGNGSDDEALRLALDLTKGSKAKIYALYVIQVKRELPLDAEIPEETAKAEQVLHHLEQLGKELKCPLEATLLQARDVGPAIVQEAVEKSVGLIVMHMPYRKRYGSFSLGDTIPYVLKNAPCQVLLSREAMTSNANHGPDHR
ncbi:MAG: universal stress protein [Chloroflexi bacterium]|nr:universal stress protein [Chloroflexota bacterium]